MIPQTNDTTVEVLGCQHRRRAAHLAVAHLSGAGAWGAWQYGSLIGGRCPSCEDDRERAA